MVPHSPSDQVPVPLPHAALVVTRFPSLCPVLNSRTAQNWRKSISVLTMTFAWSAHLCASTPFLWTETCSSYRLDVTKAFQIKGHTQFGAHDGVSEFSCSTTPSIFGYPACLPAGPIRTSFKIISTATSRSSLALWTTGKPVIGPRNPSPAAPRSPRRNRRQNLPHARVDRLGSPLLRTKPGLLPPQ
jgi:hypothetical protein